MNRALRTAATGMAAQQLNVDLIAHNLANVNTTAFKKARPEFQDLMYQTLQATGVSSNPNIQPPAEIQIGNGAVPVATTRNFSQGDAQPTSNPTDMSIKGDGFFQIRKPDGTTAYTRDGSFKISAEGEIVTSQGYIVEPGLTLPSDTASITVSRDGSVEATVSGATGTTKVGQLELGKFINPAGLSAIGDNLYVETPASGTVLTGTPGNDGFGEVVQSQLEASNVDVVEEMVNMITAQRAYEINSKTITTVSDMLSIANNIKR